MADFRKAKYSGSLNLAPECGPVHIELDTNAKTATASLEDPASQYTLAGGGGLEYIIPEQTVSNGDEVVINFDELTSGEVFIFKAVGRKETYTAALYSVIPQGYAIAVEPFKEIDANNDPIPISIVFQNSNTIIIVNDDSGDPYTDALTISAIKGF